MDSVDQLMLDICQCPNVELAKRDKSHPCHEVVSVQKGLAEFQLPEPWTGNLAGSRLLVFASNPSIDETEAYPTKDWPENWILDFFKNRFDEEYGGFGAGIHNILEAVTFGIPIIFGPNYQKFKEAKAIKKTKKDS